MKTQYCHHVTCYRALQLCPEITSDAVARMQSKRLQEAQPDSYLKARPRAVALVRDQRHSHIRFEPHTTLSIDQAHTRRYRWFRYQTCDGVEASFCYRSHQRGRIDQARDSLVSHDTRLPPFKKRCPLTGQCGLNGNGVSRLRPAAYCKSPPR